MSNDKLKKELYERYTKTLIKTNCLERLAIFADIYNIRYSKKRRKEQYMDGKALVAMGIIMEMLVRSIVKRKLKKRNLFQNK